MRFIVTKMSVEMRIGYGRLDGRGVICAFYVLGENYKKPDRTPVQEDTQQIKLPADLKLLDLQELIQIASGNIKKGSEIDKILDKM